MIANEISMGRGFKGCIKYVAEGHKRKKNPERCAWTETRNLFSADPDVAARTMRANADQSRRVEKPVYHFSLDWHPDEEDRLTRESALKAAESVLEKMGLGEHEAFIGYHIDADHPHLHVVVNRVHPKTGRAWAHWRSKSRLEKATAEVAKEQGFEMVPGRHNNLEPERDFSKRLSRGDFKRSERLETKKLTPWLKTETNALRDQIAGCFFEAHSWESLTGRLAEHRVELRTKARGLIVTDGQKFAKLSDLGKRIRLATLEKRFGQTFQQHELQQREGRPVGRLVQTQDRLMLFRREEQRVRDVGNELKHQKRAERSAQWKEVRAEETLEFHEARLEELLQVYRNPNAARKRLKRLAAENRLEDLLHRKQARWKVWRDAVTGRGRDALGRKKGVQAMGVKYRFRSSGRHLSAAQVDRAIYRTYFKIEQAKSRAETRGIETALAKGRARSAEQNFSRLKNTLGDHRQRTAERLRLHAERNEALRKISAEDIWQSDLPYDQKDELAREWERQQQFQAEREGERNRYAPRAPARSAREERLAARERDRQNLGEEKRQRGKGRTPGKHPGY